MMPISLKVVLQKGLFTNEYVKCKLKAMKYIYIFIYLCTIIHECTEGMQKKILDGKAKSSCLDFFMISAII